MIDLPGSPSLHYRGDDLHLDDCDLSRLADRFGTPLYVYSKRAMTTAFSAYEEALAERDHLVCYAVKANSTLAVLQNFARLGAGFDIVSYGELARVLAAGGDAGRVVFSGVGKTRSEMRHALEAGVGCFNVESEFELRTLADMAAAAGRRAPVSLRINPDVDVRTHAYVATGLKTSKFGIAHDRAREAYRLAASLPAIDVRGIDVHIGSQIDRIEPYVEALDRVLDLVEEVEADGCAIRQIDSGGGLAVSYDGARVPAPAEWIGALLQRLDARGHGHRRLLFEPGRSLTANAGVLVTEVVGLKRSASKNFCIVDAAMNDMPRPAMYGAWMGIEPCRRRHGTSPVWDVVGPICESGDWLARERALAVRVGDRLAILSAGAYGMSMAGNYNSRPRAAEVMVDGDRAMLIGERETVQSLFARERLID